MEKLKQLLRSTPLYPIAAAVKRWGASNNPLTSRIRRAEMNAALRFYRTFVRPGDLCFDVGAHQGIRTDVFLRLGAKVVAVEPQPKLAEQLKRKYRRDQRVVVVPQGLDQTEGQRQLHICNYSTCSTMSDQWLSAVKDWDRMRGRSWESQETVAVTTLDRLVEQHGVPAFCKIDVEGFEFNVLKGLTRPIAGISFEYNPRNLTVADQCLRHLKQLGDYEFNFSEGDSFEFALADWANHDSMAAKVADVLAHKDVYGDIYARLRSR